MRTFSIVFALCAIFTLATSASAADMPAPYVPVIEIYRTAIAEHWDEDWDKLEEHGIPVEFGYGGEKPKVIVSLADVDDDGSPELIIYDEGWDASLFAAYAIRDGSAERLFTGAGRNRWNMIHYDDGRTLFENDGSSGATNSFDFTYMLCGGELAFVRGVMYDEEASGGPWFETTTAPDFSRADYWKVGRRITEAEAVTFMAENESRRRFPKGEPVR